VKIEILQDFRHGPRQYYAGDHITVPDADGGLFCGVGWARDLAGEVETAEPDTAPKTLEVDSGSHKTTSPEV
jgi:hypothetical protein